VKEIVAESDDPLLAVAPSWERVPLADVAMILNGFAFQSKFFSNESGVPLLRIRDVGNQSTACMYQGAYDETYLVRSGDLVVGMDGDFKCATWTGPVALLNQRVCKITLTTQLYNRRFFELALPGYLDAINNRTSSQTVRHLSSRSLSEIPLPLPPLVEQERIAGKVDELLARVNSIHDHLYHIPPILKRFRQAVLAAACLGHLSEDWRDLNRHDLSCGKPPRIADTETAAEQLPPGTSLPETWAITSLGEVVDQIEAGMNIRCQEHAPGRGEKGIVKISAVTWGEFDEDESKTLTDPSLFVPTRKIGSGDLLISRANTIGLVGACVIVRSVSRDLMLSDKVLRLRVEPGLRSWVLYCLRSRLGRYQIETLATGNQMSMRNISQVNLRRIVIPLPSPEERIEIVRRVEVLFGVIDAIEHRVALAMKRADKLTRAIQAKALRGDLVPTEAELAKLEERDYESAADLLKRVRAHKSEQSAQ